MCVSRMNCVCWANLFCAVQELFQRHYGEKSCILPPEGHQGIVKMKAHLRIKVCGQKLTQTQGGGINLVMDAMSFRFLSP